MNEPSDRQMEHGRSASSIMTERKAKTAFLFALAQTGNLSLAAQSSGLSRGQISTFREADAEFEQAYNDAVEDAGDRLEAEAWRRALDGVASPLIRGGQPVIDPSTNEPIIIRRYSDPLLMLLLRGCKPEKFQMRGRSTAPADPLIGIREIEADNDPARKDN